LKLFVHSVTTSYIWKLIAEGYFRAWYILLPIINNVINLRA